MKGIIKNWSNDPWGVIPKDPFTENGVAYSDYMVSPNAVFGRTGDEPNTWPLQDRSNRGMICRGLYQHVLQSRDGSAETNWAYNAAQRDCCEQALAVAITEVTDKYSIAWEDPSYFLYHNDPFKLDPMAYAAFCSTWRAMAKYVWGWFLDYAPKSRCEVWADRTDNYPVYCPKEPGLQRWVGEDQFRSWLRIFLTDLELFSDNGNSSGTDYTGWRILNGRGAEQGWQYSQRGLCEAVYYENTKANKRQEYVDLSQSHPDATIQMFDANSANDIAFCKELAASVANGVVVWDQNKFSTAP